MFRRLIAIAALGCSAIAIPAAVSGPASAQETSHIAATWDAPDSAARVYDHGAVSADVSTRTVRTPTDNARCDLYTSTVTIVWHATGGHRFTAISVSDDDYAIGMRALDTTAWSMLPTNQVWDAKAPVLQRWYLHDTKQSSRLCPPDHASLNHVEMYVDGPAPSSAKIVPVKPPSRNHLATLWRWPDGVTTYAPERVQTDAHLYYEDEGIDPATGCTVLFTEVDLTFTALDGARIIAVGLGAPGQPTAYQRGNAATYQLGVGQHEYFLHGQKSATCPPDQLSQNRVEIYVDAGRGH